MSQLIPIEQIEIWDKNNDMRGISEEGDRRLEENLRMGQHTPILVVKLEENKYKSIGGNHRLRKMRTMGYDQVDCVIVTWLKDKEGYFPAFDGRVYNLKDGKPGTHFPTIEQGEMELALSHNTNPAFYLSDGLANAIGEFPSIDVSKFDVQFVEPVSLGEVANEPEPVQEKGEKEQETTVYCPACYEELIVKKNGDKIELCQTPDNQTQQETTQQTVEQPQQSQSLIQPQETQSNQQNNQNQNPQSKEKNLQNLEERLQSANLSD